MLGCQGGPASQPEARPAIEILEGGTVSARVIAGHPCRATIGSVEMLVGGRPLIAQLGASRWTGHDASNGVTFKTDDVVVARLHANQLFDAQGLPLLRVMDNGDIVSGPGRVIRKAVVTRPADKQPQVEIRDAGGHRSATPTPGTNVIATGTTNVALAAILSAPEVAPELRALSACHYLLPGSAVP